MKNKIIYILAIILIIELGIVFSEMGTNARYSASVDLYSDLDLASTYYNGTLTTSSPVSINLGGNTTIQYALTNKVSTNINENNLQFYLNLLDENNEEATKITIEYINYNDTQYDNYVEGKGFGPISLAHDGITEETENISIRLVCGNDFSSRQTVNYKINLLAEDVVDSSINKNQTSDITLNVNLNTITYVLNGGINNSANPSVFAPNATVVLSNPTKVGGYEFDGWYENSDFSGAKITSIAERSEDITLYAKWKRISKIYFQAPGDWSSSVASVYLYNTSNSNTNASWPGEAAEMENSSLNIFSFEISEEDISDFDRIIFVNKTKTTSGSSSRQTLDIDFDSESLGKIFVPQLYKPTNGEIRIFVRKALIEKKDKTTYANSIPYIYNWIGGTSTSVKSWPGNVTTAITYEVYKTVVNNPNSYNKFIINFGSNTIQTSDLDVPNYQDFTCQFYGNKNQKVGRLYYDGAWCNYNTWLVDDETTGKSNYDNWNENDNASFIASQN